MAGRAANQLALPLDWTDDDQGFLVGVSNEAAVRHLEHHATWPVRASVLTGPEGSGRTMLARLFARATGAEVIDQVEGRPDEELFHAWNRAHEARRPLLFVADTPPALWPVVLPDLRSRLMAVPVATIGEPDDGLALALIERLFAQRATPIAPDLAGYLVTRIERSYAAIHKSVNLLDQAALAARKRVGVRLARETLGDAGELGSGKGS
ncbi:MAG: chromosomal replication initiator DnaA [Sphingomonadales bacterium]|nr:chromosomal replication initiator DnaA [Sphingomonadales bacterium]